MLNDASREILQDMGLLWPLLTAAFGLGVAVWQWGKNRATQKLLDDATRRSEGPRFVCMRIGLLNEHKVIEHSLADQIPSGLPAGIMKVGMLLRNDGATIYEAGDDQPSGLGFIFDSARSIQSGDGCIFSYLYDDAQRGKWCQLTVTYVSEATGFKQSQRYEYLHGFPQIRRVDPA